LVIPGALVMNPFALNHDAQLQPPDREFKPGLEAIDIASDRRPARLGGAQGFHPGPPTPGYFDRIEATPAVEQLEQMLLEKAASMRNSSVSARRPRWPRISPISSRNEALRALAVVDVARGGA
jgi:hypothetical protein